MLGKDIRAGDWLVIIKNGERTLRQIREVAHRGAGVDLHIGLYSRPPGQPGSRSLPLVVGRSEEVSILREP